jgi:hypothetical protein
MLRVRIMGVYFRNISMISLLNGGRVPGKRHPSATIYYQILSYYVVSSMPPCVRELTSYFKWYMYYALIT